ncbi:MAG: hypothetical protein AAF969_14865 [Bacteroidota bacterium]
MKNYGLFRIIALLIYSFLLACSAEDGEDGAIGPQGEQGIQGPSGEDANVIASDWMDVTFSSVSGNIISTVLTDARITTEVIENSVFLMYARNSVTEPQSIVTIPFTEPILGVSFYYVLDASINEIEVVGVYFPGATPIPDLINQVRFVIIPATMDSSALVNLSYDDMVTQFGLD